MVLAASSDLQLNKREIKIRALLAQIRGALLASLLEYEEGRDIPFGKKVLLHVDLALPIRQQATRHSFWHVFPKGYFLVCACVCENIKQKRESCHFPFFVVVMSNDIPIIMSLTVD